jgi:hypothetical protein
MTTHAPIAIDHNVSGITVAKLPIVQTVLPAAYFMDLGVGGPAE